MYGSFFFPGLMMFLIVSWLLGFIVRTDSGENMGLHSF